MCFNSYILFAGYQLICWVSCQLLEQLGPGEQKLHEVRLTFYQNQIILLFELTGLEKEPKLSAVLVPVLHKYAVTQNLSPVKVNLDLKFKVYSRN